MAASKVIKLVNNEDTNYVYRVGLSNGLTMLVEAAHIGLVPEEMPLFVSFLLSTKNGEDTEVAAIVPIDEIVYVMNENPFKDKARLLV